MGHREIGPPFGVIYVEAIFFEAGEVDDSEVAGAGLVEGRGLADVIKSGPDELAADVGEAVLGGEFGVGGGGPAWVVEVIGAHLAIGDVLAWRRALGAAAGGSDGAGERGDGEGVFAAGGDCGGGFGAVDEFVGEGLMEGGVVAEGLLAAGA